MTEDEEFMSDLEQQRTELLIENEKLRDENAGAALLLALWKDGGLVPLELFVDGLHAAYLEGVSDATPMAA